MIVFRPFKGEILFGKISYADEEGLKSKKTGFCRRRHRRSS